MKIRNGFVSNSSSSSFIAIAREVNIDDISVKDIRNKKYYTFGKNLSDGVDLIDITSEDMLKFFQFVKGWEGYWKKEFIPFKFYEIIKEASEDSIHFSKKDLNDDEYVIISDDIDYHSSETLDDLLENYCEENKNKILQKINRNKKLGRILDEK